MFGFFIRPGPLPSPYVARFSSAFECRRLPPIPVYPSLFPSYISLSPHTYTYPYKRTHQILADAALYRFYSLSLTLKLFPSSFYPHKYPKTNNKKRKKMSAWEVIFQILLVVAPHIGYVAQYFEIARTNSIEGYAPLVSLILLTSNTLRLFYYIGKHYLLALLFQAIVGVLVHFGLLLKVLDVHVSQVVDERQEDVLFGSGAITPSPIRAAMSMEETGGKPVSASSAGAPDNTTRDDALAAPYSGNGSTVLAEPEDASASPVKAAFSRFMRFLFMVEDALEQRLLRLTPRNFAFSYIASSAVTLVVVLVYFISIGRIWKDAHAVVGYLSLGIESLLVLPQILRNARRQSTEGLSILLILTWAGGDIIKVIYFTYAKQALPFIVCGIFQTVLDVVVVAQVIYYRFYLRNEARASGAAAPL